MNSENTGFIQSSQALPPGTRIEEFVIERILGSGGFGITYLARDTALGRQVVIKENLPVQFCFRDTQSLTVAPRHSQSDDADNFRWSLENFSKEAAMLASLNHLGIVQVLRSFQAFGTAYFVMPFVEGVTLEELLYVRKRKGEAFTEEELRGLLQRVLLALDHLHQRGIYHRDIKPGNILITHEGIPVLIDFGSARQRLSERSMTVVESAGYTPFEQLQTRGRIGPWSDLYALGATLAKAITGEAPPKATDRAFDDPWMPLGRRPEWTARHSVVFLASIDRSMAVRIEDRFQTAGEWLVALENETTPASHSSPSRKSVSEARPHPQNPIPDEPGHQQTQESKRGRRRHLLVAMLGLLVAGALIGVVIIGRDRERQDDDAKTSMVENRVVSQTEPEMPTARVPEQEEKQPPVDEPAASNTTVGRVPLDPGFPPELIEGTPRPMNVPNLLPIPTRPTELLVPADSILLSRSMKVTSSDNTPIIGSLDLITDGAKEAGEGFFVEIRNDLQWVQIDLGLTSTISAVCLWHFHSQKRAYHDVIIQVSDDPEFIKAATTIYNNDYDNSAGMGIGANQPYVETRFGLLVDAKGTKGRYIRLYSNGNTSNEMNHYIEVEVFGMVDRGASASIPQSMPKVEGEKPGEEMVIKIAPGVSMTFCWIPPGEFMMGSPYDELGRDKDESQHRVKISRGFWMGKTEVTQAQWSAGGGLDTTARPPGYWGGESRIHWANLNVRPDDFRGETSPVERVDWSEASSWCAALDKRLREGGALDPGWSFVLPSEAEWEYACRAGTRNALNNNRNLSSEKGACTNLMEVGWYSSNSGGVTRPVGLKKPNAWGLYDMHGNVWEWCADWHGDYSESDQIDPSGPTSEVKRVVRGGGWKYLPSTCRSANRDKLLPDDRGFYLGFRPILRRGVDR